MILNNNIVSLNIYSCYSNALQQESNAMNQISSGLKINSAKDDPYGITQSEQMKMQIRGMQMASKNAQDGISMLQAAEGGLNDMTSSLQRVRQLVVQAGNGTNTTEDKQEIQTEIDQLINGMDTIAGNTEFNGKQLLAQNNNLTMTIGANAGESITIPQQNLTSGNLVTSDGKSLQQLKSNGQYSIASGNNTDTALNIIDSALNTIVSVNSKYGALENRFQESVANLNEMSETIQGADSNLTDADIAGEMAEYAKDNVLTEAGTAMMAQSNKLPQEVLQILANVK